MFPVLGREGLQPACTGCWELSHMLPARLPEWLLYWPPSTSWPLSAAASGARQVGNRAPPPPNCLGSHMGAGPCDRAPFLPQHLESCSQQLPHSVTQPGLLQGFPRVCVPAAALAGHHCSVAWWRWGAIVLPGQGCCRDTAPSPLSLAKQQHATSWPGQLLGESRDSFPCRLSPSPSCGELGQL